MGFNSAFKGLKFNVAKIS